MRSGSQADAPGAEEGGLPLVITDTIKNAARLSAISPQARRAGLAVRLTLADARPRIPDLWVEEADARADMKLLEQIAEDCDRFTPVVVMDGVDGLLLDITGCTHLFGGEGELRKTLMGRITRAGIHVRGVLASAPLSARALVRHGRRSALMPNGIVPAGQDEAAVRPLPVAALDLDDDTRLAIVRAGLKTVGDIVDRPARAFSARFGEAMTLHLRRVMGKADVPLTPLRIVPEVWVERRFVEPIARTEDIEAVLHELALEAGARLAERRQGGRAFEASFFRTDGAIRRIVIETGRPMRDAKTLLRLFRERLDALADPLDPGFGFDLVRLSIPAANALDAAQAGLDGRALEEGEVADLADRLSARFGEDRVVRFLPRNTHNPDRAAEAAPASFNPLTSAVWPMPEQDEPPLRPSQIFDPPQLIMATAEVPDAPPRSFLWRKVRYVVRHSEGPERIAPEWWLAGSDARTRDYYRVEDGEGRRFWLFRAGSYEPGKKNPDWFVHGVFA
ncbi:MAG TPA: DNA polymerase Y family protein [Hyphomonadaceae bacterium]|nr:DNA polymerase Y family protein [Hyphomonadaceae bacterium]